MKKQINKFLTILLPLIFLVGCSGSKTPSESDIKTSLQEMFSNCSPVKINNVKKINGQPISDTLYKVQISFELEVSPLSQNLQLEKEFPQKKEMYKKIIAEREAEYDTLGEKSLKEKIEQAYEKQRFLLKEIGSSDRSSEKYKKSSDEYDILKQEIAKYNQELSKLENTNISKMQEIHQKYEEKLKAIGPGDSSSLFSIQRQNFLNECKVSDQFASKLIVGTMGTGVLGARIGGDMKGLKEKISESFTAERIMMKTEKGWRFQL